MQKHHRIVQCALLAIIGLGASAECPAQVDGESATNTLPTGPAPALRLDTLEVIGERFDRARSGLSPRTGTSQFVFDQRDIEQLPLGENTPIDKLMLLAPGVVQGDYGELHIRGEMTQPQYRINGIIIPEGISGFGEVFDLRFAKRVEFITGALPAQYNYRTNIIDIETKQSFENGARVSLTGGSYGTINPAIEVSGSVDRLTYLLTGSDLHARNGILLPTADRQAIHDDTSQSKGFAMLSYVIDPRSRLTLMAGAAQSQFQIPDVRGQTPGYPLDGDGYFPDLASSDLNENQRELNRYAVLSYEGNNGSNLDYQVAFFTRYSSVAFTPDPIGDLIYRGIASGVTRRNRANGLQADATLEQSQAHTVRAGFSVSRQRTDSANDSLVFPADADGVQVPGDPFTVLDERSITATLAGAFLQDEWKASSGLTVNYGLRFDYLNGLTQDTQLSPRLNAVYKFDDDTALHAGYARFFDPPRLELIGPDTVSKFANTTNQPEVQEASPVVPERIHYLDVGVTHRLTPSFTVGMDSYAKYVDHLVDFGQFGQALVYSPFNWTKAKIYGVEFSARYRRENFSASLNTAVSWARAKGISSGQYNFGKEEIDYIDSHWVYMDHDQRLASSASLAYTWSGVLFTADAVFGSGMRSTPDGGTPNSDHLPFYSQATLGIAHEFRTPGRGTIGARLSVINLFDRAYEIRDGTGVGVGAPQFGPRRTILGTLSASY